MSSDEEKRERQEVGRPIGSQSMADHRDLAWMQWLARNAYGVDFAFKEQPPVTLDEYSTVMAQVADDGEDPETWAWCIEQETGPWSR